MEAKTALVRTNGRVELYAVANVHLYVAIVVNPWHTESDDTLWLYQALNNTCLFKFRVLVIHFFYR